MDPFKIRMITNRRSVNEKNLLKALYVEVYIMAIIYAYYLRCHKGLSPYQCGFLKCHSTEWAAGSSRIQFEGTLIKAG